MKSRDITEGRRRSVTDSAAVSSGCQKFKPFLSTPHSSHDEDFFFNLCNVGGFLDYQQETGRLFNISTLFGTQSARF